MRGWFWLTLVLFSCKGPAGDDGANGKDGVNGEDGAPGAPGGPGSDGSDGADGGDGADGFGAHFGTAPWGISLTIDDVLGGTGANGAILAGDTLTVLFRVEDHDGIPYQLGELRGLDFQLVGPTDHMQVVLERSDFGDPEDDSVWDPVAEQYSLVVPTAVPAVFAAPANDTVDITLEDGDWGGEPLVDGTYQLTAWANIRHTWTDGTTWTEGGHGVFDLLYGAATVVEPHEVVLDAACDSCHGTFYAHGGSRQDMQVCVACHVAGSEDRYSQTDPLNTPAAGVDMAGMIHGIHMGADRPDALFLNGFPANPALPGYPDYNEHDFSQIHFPIWPRGVADCATCHEGAAQGDVENRPSTLACTGCHSDVNLRDGTNHLGGPQPDDSQCAGACHQPADILGYHADIRDDPAINPGLTVTAIGINGATGPGGAFQVGDTVEVEFSVDDDSGALIALGDLIRAEAVMAGPNDHYQRILVSPSGDVLANAVLDGVSNTYRYTLGTIPATYPAQANDTTDLGIEVGDWFGEPLADGTYRVAVFATREVTDGMDTERVSHSDTFDVLVGGATTLATRDVIDEAACESCHQMVIFHGSYRRGAETCVTCHTAGAEDRYSATDPLTTPAATIDWRVMVHKIHNGSELEQQPYELNGFGFPYTTHAYDHLVFPRFDGGTSQCTACHGASDAWKEPSTTVCTSCHDGTATQAHAALNTDPVWGESCTVCHSVGSSQAVDVVHDWGRAH